MAAVARLLELFRADPHHPFDDGELAMLEAAAGHQLLAAQAAALNLFRRGELRRALPMAIRIADELNESESIKNVAVLLRDLKEPEQGLKWLLDRQDRVEAIARHDLLCSLYDRGGKREEALHHGNIALRLKDESVPAGPSPSQFKVTTVPIDAAKKVISFSLWGANPRYLGPARRNALIAPYLYPGWTTRFHVDDSVPGPLIQELRALGAEVRMVTDLPARHYGLMWRFLVEEDPSVDLYIVRDADSVVNIQERWAVTDWLRSGKAFHVMRDHPQHSEVMLAGMWGAHRGNLPNLREHLVSFAQKNAHRANFVHRDQIFLREHVWPIARQSLMTHDRHFDLYDPKRFDPWFQLPAGMHVGENDFARAHIKPPSTGEATETKTG